MTVHPVYIVDDDYAVRRSTRFLLDQAGRPSRTFVDGREFLARVDTLEAGCVLLDLRMPGLDGLEVQQALAGRSSFPVVVVTGHGDVPQAVSAMQAGAVDFLEKPFAADDLLAAIARADRRLDEADAIADHAAAAARKLACLTPRERDVLDGLAQGHPNKTIAYDLGISPRTVEVHRAHLMEKLGAHNLADVLRLCFAVELAAAPADTDTQTS